MDTEEAKSLPLGAFPGLQICQNCFWNRGHRRGNSVPDSVGGGGVYSAPPISPIPGSITRVGEQLDLQLSRIVHMDASLNHD